MIAELLASSPDQQFYGAKMTVLSEEINTTSRKKRLPVTASSRKPARPASTW
jgi:hypothetical protein